MDIEIDTLIVAPNDNVWDTLIDDINSDDE